MARAIELALENVRSGRGGPFAALIVEGDRIVASGTNLVTSSNDPTAHAEIVAIRSACAALQSFVLARCEIYATCEPCPMCLGAIYWSRLRAVWYGCSAADAAEAGFDDAFIYRQIATAPAERTIPFRSLMRDQALGCFREWQRCDKKIPY